MAFEETQPTTNGEEREKNDLKTRKKYVNLKRTVDNSVLLILMNGKRERRRMLVENRKNTRKTQMVSIRANGYAVVCTREYRNPLHTN